MKNIKYIVSPGKSISGKFRVPGDKSISHRSIMLGALADGTTNVTGFLSGEDSLSTLKAFQAMGVDIEGPVDGNVTIKGVGIDGLKAPSMPLDLGNSGTSMRLMSGLLAGQKFDVTLIGDESLSSRPMKRVTNPLALMGAKIDTTEKGTAPLKVNGGAGLKGITYDMPMASAQVKSCLLLAGLYADGKTVVTEPAPTRDHTERMLTGFGYKVGVNGATITVEGGGRLTATDIDIPTDISSAAFFMVAAAIADDSEVVIQHVGINPTRTGIIDILKLMNANISIEKEKVVGGEPIADIRVKSSGLKGINIPEELVPLAIDEFPVLFIAAACAEGKTVLSGAEELRVKESDRIQVMADGLVELGVDAQPTEDGMIINGVGKGGRPFAGGTVHSHHDHRIAMSFAVASLKATADIEINDCVHVNTSFPGFAHLAQQVGIQLQEVEV
ncbi:MAG: 3-phosphoshikimate 1-carboxyvinyltransferase [Gammaproteobacteria bacterium]|nr:MAG: 3-phosphoshikimate 1-carboxyvinyltransferase [Gammaproteobacteria bacterium]